MSGRAVDVTCDLPLRDRLLLAQYAEARGLDMVWLAERGDRDVGVELAALALGTERIRIGGRLAVARGADALAALAASLDELAPGRTVLDAAPADGGADAERAQSADAIRARIEQLAADGAHA